MVAMTTHSSCKPRVLFVGVGRPWLGGAGYLVRQNMFLQALARCAHLHLAMFEEDGHASDSHAKGPPFECEVSMLPAPESIEEGRLSGLVNDLLLSRPMMLRGRDCRSAREIVDRLDPERFDAVCAFRIDFAHFAGVLDHPRLLLDIDDPEHVRQAQKRELHDETGDLFGRIDLYRLRRFERQAASRALAAFVCQQRDAAAFAPFRTIIVPNCIDVPANLSRRTVDDARLLFVGNMRGDQRSPNVDAVRWFVHSVWPIVRANVPRATCRFVGATTDDLNQRLSSVPGVECAGFIDDLAGEYAAAAVCIAPIRIGTGTRIKILEACAHGCPVVSTRKGCEGLELRENRDVLLADEPNEFAMCCCRLISDRALAEQFGSAGREVVRRRYSLQTQVDELTATLNALLLQAKGARSSTARARTEPAPAYGDPLTCG